MFLHVGHAGSESMVGTVDADVVVVASCCFRGLGVSRMWIEFGVGDGAGFVAIREVVSSLPQTLCASLPSFRAFTGCDAVSSFFGFGGGEAWDCWMLDLSKFCDLFSGLDFSSLPSSFDALERFVIALCCGSSDAQGVDECRCSVFGSGCPVEGLPPASAALAERTGGAVCRSEM